MSAKGTPDCQDRAGHQLHLCQLKQRGLSQEIALRSNAASFVCHNCSAVANRAEDLCNPSPLPKRI